MSKIRVTIETQRYGTFTKLLDEDTASVIVGSKITGVIVKAELAGPETISNVDDVPGHHQTGISRKAFLASIHNRALMSFPDVKRVQIRWEKDKATTVPSYPVSTSDMLILNDAFRGKAPDEHGRILLTVEGRRFRQEMAGDKLLFFAVAGGDTEDRKQAAIQARVATYEEELRELAKQGAKVDAEIGHRDPSKLYKGEEPTDPPPVDPKAEKKPDLRTLHRIILGSINNRMSKIRLVTHDAPLYGEHKVAQSVIDALEQEVITGQYDSNDLGEVDVFIEGKQYMKQMTEGRSGETDHLAWYAVA